MEANQKRAINKEFENKQIDDEIGQKKPKVEIVSFDMFAEDAELPKEVFFF